MTLMERLLAAGYPREQMFSHGSDLYIFATPKTARIVESWFKENGLVKSLFCSTFKDQVTGRTMFDCAFQYDDYWKAVCKGVEE